MRRRKIPIPCRNLFTLLKHLGVRQRRIATALGLRPSEVSEIANGKRSLPSKHAPILYFLLLELVGFIEVGKHPQGHEIQLSEADAAQFRRDVLHYLGAWVLELNATHDLLKQEVADELGRGAVLVGKPLTACTPNELDFIAWYGKEVLKAHKFLRQLAETNTNHKPDPNAPLITVLRQAFRLAGIEIDVKAAEADTV
jgi:transcriptional regulator with XRE-family HTH domain